MTIPRSTAWHLLGAVCLLLGACSEPRPPTMTVEGAAVIRQVAWELDVADPNPVWNPGTDIIACRIPTGFAILRERGQERIERFRSEDRRETGHPAWLDATTLVFGPLANVQVLPDGRIQPAADGLSLVEVRDGGLKSAVGERRRLAPQGWRPRVADQRIFVQVAEHMLRFDVQGRSEDLGEGFYCEPQPGGEGLCWQETPVPETDHWTGKPAAGILVVRWAKGQVTQVPGALQARWTGDGRVVATRLRGPLAPLPAWWTGGTEVVVISRDGAVRPVAEGARDPEPHPVAPLVAVSDAGGGIRLCPLDGSPGKRLALVGTRPRWNRDGSRLLVEEPLPGTPSGSVVRMLVLK